MKIPALIIALITINFFFIPAQAADDLYETKAVLQQLRLIDNLKVLGTQIIKATETYAMIVGQLGPGRAEELLNEKMAATLPKYQGQWDINLAQSYQQYMTVDKLHALSKKDPASPAYKKFINEQNSIGLLMQKKSDKLLTDFAAEVLNAMFITLTGPRKN